MSRSNEQKHSNRRCHEQNDKEREWVGDGAENRQFNWVRLLLRWTGYIIVWLTALHIPSLPSMLQFIMLGLTVVVVVVVQMRIGFIIVFRNQFMQPSIVSEAVAKKHCIQCSNFVFCHHINEIFVLMHPICNTIFSWYFICVRWRWVASANFLARLCTVYCWMYTN